MLDAAARGVILGGIESYHNLVAENHRRRSVAAQVFHEFANKFGGAADVLLLNRQTAGRKKLLRRDARRSARLRIKHNPPPGLGHETASFAFFYQI